MNTVTKFIIKKRAKGKSVRITEDLESDARIIATNQNSGQQQGRSDCRDYSACTTYGPPIHTSHFKLLQRKCLITQYRNNSVTGQHRTADLNNSFTEQHRFKN